MLRNASTKAVGRTRAAVQQQARRIPETASTGPSQAFRSFATNDKKRALNAQQLKGGAKPEPPKAPEPPPPAVESSSGGPGTTATVLTFLAATSGAMYYNGFLDEYMGDKTKPTTSVVKEKKPEKTKTEKKAEKTPSPKELVAKAAAPEKVTTKKKTTRTKADEKLAKEAKEGVTISKKEMDDFNDIIGDVLGEATVEVEGVQEAVAAIAEEEEKAKAAAAARAAAKAKADADAKAKALAAAKAKETAAKESAADEPVIVMPTAAIATSALDESKILAEIQDLKKQLAERSDGALQEAHTELAKLSSFDVMGLDLDKMTKSQLKVRLVQMARDLEERTKWEAVRLQEFLSMKEKEVEDKYLLLMKKMRLEAEQLQEEKLEEQKKILTAQAEEALQEQQARSDAFLENSMQIQEKAHADDKISFEATTKEAMDAKYEEFFGQEVVKIKEDFANKMSQRVRQMDELTKKLTELEISLKTSQDFQVGSLEAHRITAAAIALMEKLESGDPAGAAVRALEAVASENAVVSAAVQSLPAAVSLSGVSTLQQLQTAFEETIYPQCRKAANVPPGSNGLEGQLLGSVFSLMSFPPGPDEAAPESEKDASEYVLARIKRYVQLGELEKAIVESKKLEGQVAFTAKDWEAQARDRVAVEKALKVIRMECALANETLTTAS